MNRISLDDCRSIVNCSSVTALDALLPSFMLKLKAGLRDDDAAILTTLIKMTAARLSTGKRLVDISLAR